MSPKGSYPDPGDIGSLDEELEGFIKGEVKNEEPNLRPML
jgi:hypothetical protein